MTTTEQATKTEGTKEKTTTLEDRLEILRLKQKERNERLRKELEGRKKLPRGVPILGRIFGTSTA